MATFDIDLSVPAPPMTSEPPVPCVATRTDSNGTINMVFGDDLVLTASPAEGVSAVRITAVIVRERLPNGFIFAWTASDSPPWQGISSLAPSPGPWPWPDPFPAEGFLSSSVPSGSDAEVAEITFTNVDHPATPPDPQTFELRMIIWGTAQSGSATYAWLHDPELSCQSGTNGPGYLIVQPRGLLSGGAGA